MEIGGANSCCGNIIIKLLSNGNIARKTTHDRAHSVPVITSTSNATECMSLADNLACDVTGHGHGAIGR